MTELKQPFYLSPFLNQELEHTTKAMLGKIASLLLMLYLLVNKGRIVSSTTTVSWVHLM